VALVIAVLDYGIGNLRSAQKALAAVGADARLVTAPHDARGADGVVLPGVGAFGRCMEALRESGLEGIALDAVGGGLPFLGICVGFQMLYEGSEEAPGVTGLGALRGTVRSLPPEVKSPQMQWNELRLVEGRQSGLLERLGGAPWVYFLHSFAPEYTDDVVATCEYGGDLVSVAERGHIWGAQFHPEKSGRVGLRMLSNFVAACAEADGAEVPLSASRADAEPRPEL
jgi:imidazole glycerol-phosphate synthase subunit HisH